MVDKVEGVDCPWRVVFVVDGVECGHGEYQSWDQADAAGEEWRFSGWGDESCAPAIRALGGVALFVVVGVAEAWLPVHQGAVCDFWPSVVVVRGV